VTGFALGVLPFHGRTITTKEEARVELKVEVEVIKYGHHNENQEGASVLTP